MDQNDTERLANDGGSRRPYCLAGPLKVNDRGGHAAVSSRALRRSVPGTAERAWRAGRIRGPQRKMACRRRDLAVRRFPQSFRAPSPPAGEGGRRSRPGEGEMSDSPLFRLASRQRFALRGARHEKEMLGAIAIRQSESRAAKSRGRRQRSFAPMQLRSMSAARRNRRSRQPPRKAPTASR